MADELHFYYVDMLCVQKCFNHFVCVLVIVLCIPAEGTEKPHVSDQRPAAVPTPEEYPRSRDLLKNAMKYPPVELIDPDSGYLYEGWNSDKATSLRHFTQITAVGKWIEYLGEIVVGRLSSENFSRDQALCILQRAAKSLLKDQKNPSLSADGLLVNFFTMNEDQRKSLLTKDVVKGHFEKAFGPEEGAQVWEALNKKGWIHSVSELDAWVDRKREISDEQFSGPRTLQHPIKNV